MKLTLPQGYSRIRFRRRRRARHKHGNLLPITELEPGERGEITCIKGNRKIIQRLADLGLTPNTCISIVKTAPFNGPVEIAVRGCKLAIGRDIAENILVKMKEN